MDILLHGPAVDNARRYRDAGSVLTVGTEPDQITPDRAQPYLDADRAIEAEPAEGE